MSNTPTIKNLPIGLLITRISIVLFLLPWVIPKFTNPEMTIGLFSKYYLVSALPEAAAYGVAAIWGIVLFMFAFGIKKRISYGLVALFHGAATFFTIPRMIPGSENFTILFLASIPTLAAMIVLYLMRDHDTIGTIGK